MTEETLSGLTLFNRGKVRDIYSLGDKLLLVASDRISAFDVVLPTLIPDKGKILTKLSEFWFGVITDIVPHHLVSTNVEEFPAACQPHKAKLDGRSMLVRKTIPAPVECIVRGMEGLSEDRIGVRHTVAERLRGSFASGGADFYAVDESACRRP
jgi:phosphoribosylaminoimidazole-succinocarboxamide synthase